MPTNVAVREMLPPKRVTWASRYSRSKTSRASRSGSCMISPPLLPAQHRRRILADIAGQHVGADRPAARRRQDQQPLDDVAQLADVARPVVALQRGQRVLAHRPGRQAGGVGDAPQQIGRQLRDVLAALAERRHAQRHHVQAMEQLLAEAAGGDLVLQIAEVEASTRTSTSTASCRRRARRTAPAAPRQRLCRGQRQVGHFLQQQRAAMRQLEGARDAQRSPSAVSVPNSSISSRSAGRVEQFTTTNGPSARFDPGGSAAPPSPCRRPRRR